MVARQIRRPDQGRAPKKRWYRGAIRRPIPRRSHSMAAMLSDRAPSSTRVSQAMTPQLRLWQIIDRPSGNRAAPAQQSRPRMATVNSERHCEGGTDDAGSARRPTAIRPTKRSPPELGVGQTAKRSVAVDWAWKAERLGSIQSRR